MADDGPRVKRRRTSKDGEETSITQGNQILSSQDLRPLFVFVQDIAESKSRLHQLKLFLSGVRELKENDERLARKHLLLDALSSEKAADPLGGLIETWHFASQLNNDSLCSTVPAVLTSILKTLSDVVEFRDLGVNICRKLLQEDQLKLFETNLNAQKFKQHLFDPVLRLLTEIMFFDGGCVAKNVYRLRNVTFNRLDVFLSTLKEARDDTEDVRKRPTLRETALRYLLANIKLQDRPGKSFLLSQYRITHALFHFLDKDPPWLINSVLQTIQKHVLDDGTLPDSIKRKVFHESALKGLATLYQSKDESMSPTQSSMLSNLHSLLLSVFALTENFSILRRTKLSSSPVGEYHNKDREGFVDEATDVQALNSHVARFLSRLRPYADTLQASLLVDVFRTRPDLLSVYFLEKNSISLDPKLTVTWVGYARFVLAVVQLPCHEALLQRQSQFHELTRELLHTLLPPPCDKKTMTRCLNHASDLINFVSVAILNAALFKFQSVVHFLKNTVGTKQRDNLIRDMQTEFASYCPEIRHVITGFLNCPEENLVLKESLARLLSRYYQCMPAVTLVESFDASPKLSSYLQAMTNSDSKTNEDQGFQSLMVQHLLQIAQQSLETQWWRSGSQMSITFGLLLSSVGMKQPMRSRRLAIVCNKLVDDYVLRPEMASSIVKALRLSLEKAESSLVNEIVSFLDECASKAAQLPVKYDDRLAEMKMRELQEQHPTCKMDLLLVCIIEQWPHLQRMRRADIVEGIAKWMKSFLQYVNMLEPDKRIEVPFLRLLEESSDIESLKTIIHNDQGDMVDEEVYQQLLGNSPEDTVEQEQPGSSLAPLKDSESIEDPLRPPPTESDDHPELYRWSREDIQDAVSEGMVGKLILCLCSETESARKEAIPKLKECMVRLNGSTFGGQSQARMVIGELLETCVDFGEGRLPYFVGVMAAECLLIVTDPLHLMYTKVCNFLYRAPKWNVQKIPSYWIRKIMLSESTEIGGQIKEIFWLLELLLDGLRTTEDMRLYTTNKVLERLLSICTFPTLSDDCMLKAVEILVRSTFVDGSTSLITRYGLLAWTMGLCTRSEVKGRRLAQLARTAWERCEQEHVEAWSDGACSQMIKDIEI